MTETAPSSSPLLEQFESGRLEIRIESKSCSDVSASHDQEAHVIHEAKAALTRLLEFAHSHRVQLSIDPLDRKGIYILEKLYSHVLAQSGLKQRKTFDDDIVVREQFFLAVHDRPQYLNRAPMIRV